MNFKLGSPMSITPLLPWPLLEQEVVFINDQYYKSGAIFLRLIIWRKKTFCGRGGGSG